MKHLTFILTLLRTFVAGLARVQPRQVGILANSATGCAVVLISVLLASWPGRSQAATVEADICIYGGTSGGVVAAVQAARMGKTVILA